MNAFVPLPAPCNSTVDLFQRDVHCLLGVGLPERVTGAGLFERLGEPAGASAPISVYFFGGAVGVAAEACRRVNARGGGLACAGHDDAGTGSVEQMSGEERIARINASGADLLVVSISAKKGQAWIERNRARLAVPVVCNLGAVVNFAAGTIRRAPPWMQSGGLEWLWRIREEKALWRRYAGDGMAFLGLLATRVLPLAWQLRRHRPAPADVQAAAIYVSESWCDRVIRPRGAWLRANLQPLRDCFARHALDRKNLRLDLSRVTHADPSFLGLLLLLQGLRGERGLRTHFGPVNAYVARLMKYGCGEFLLRPA
jgi:N-acetylglucosaminyldiphosphoundecaprenol N-acetyl-beta-D-mannosaminyltransferase